MGTGGSKFKKTKRQKIVAEIVVPGQSVPIKVKGEVNLPGNEEVATHHSGAKVKEVGPNKFSIQLDNKNVVTFNTEGDFHAHLTNAAELKITNIETVPDNEETPTTLSTSYSFNLTPSLDDYSDDEDWEDIFNNMDDSQSSSDEVDGADISEAKQRKTEIKRALQAKRANLSPEEYQQMISNHKQEMELMEMLREKELDRQKISLASKVADRKKRRLARIQEASQKEQLNVQNKVEKTQDNGKQPDPEMLNLQVLLQTNIELEAEINQRNMAFEQQMQNVRPAISEKEYRKLLLQHKAQVSALSRKLEIGRDNQRIHLMEKLMQRSKKNNSADEKEKPMRSEEVKELQLALNTKDVEFRKQLTRTKSTLTSQESERLINEHKKEMQELQHQLEKERNGMQQHLMDKLKLRMINDKTEEDSNLSSEDLKQLQLGIDAMIQTTNVKMKEQKNKMSKDEYNEILTKQRNETDALQKQLEVEKKKTDQWLQKKMAARNSLIKWNTVINAATNQSIQELEAEIKQRKESWEKDKKDKKSALSKEEYDLLMKQHKDEVDQLEKRLNRQRDAQRQHLLDKLAERRARKHKNAIGLSADEVKEMQLAIAGKDVSFKAEIKVNEGQRSSEEVQKLIDQHKEEMKNFQQQLDVEREKMRERLLEKVAARQKHGLSDEDESLTEEEIKQTQIALDVRTAIFKENIKETKSALTSEEYQLLLDNHLKEQQQLHDHLDKEREKMNASLKDEVKRRKRDRLAARLAARSGIQAEMQNTGDGMQEVEQAELQDTEDGMQEFSVLESAIDVSSFAKTQLWTTPVQSKSLVVVPLPEEYPVKKKRELYTDPSIFRNIDSHAIKLAQTGSLVMYPTFSALVDELMRIGTTELEKARLAFRWITAQNCDEMDLSEVVDDTPLGVLKGIYFHKITFSTLFMRMCRFIGLRCVEINGCAKVKGYKPGMSISLEDTEYLHTWNAVRIDGHWHFVDCNWGVSHIADSVTFDPFRFEYDEHYFLADPEVIVATHFPNEGAWQLVPQPLTLQQFNAGVLLKPDFFKFDFQLLNFPQAVVHLTTGDLDLRIGHPLGFLLSCKVLSLDGDRNMTSNDVSFEQFVFIHQVAENQMSIYVRFPEAGKFYLVVYAKRQYVDGQVNIETETEICRYQVICDNPSADQYPLPISPADHWGPIGVGNAGLVPLTHRTAVVVSNGEPVTIGFKYSQHLIFHCKLTCQEVASHMLQPYVMHRKFKGNVLFTITPPHASRFAMNIYITYPTDPQQHTVHLCSYLVVVNTLKETDVLPIPVMKNWGETTAFANLGLKTISHEDPFIVVSSESIEVKIGITQHVFAQPRLHYYSAKSGVTDLTPNTHGQSSGNCITFLLHLPDKGYYVFKILGSDSIEDELPMSLCFIYLIKRC